MFRAPRAEVGSRVEEEKEKMERERGEGPKKTTPPHHDSGICRYCQHAGECTAVVQGEATSPVSQPRARRAHRRRMSTPTLMMVLMKARTKNRRRLRAQKSWCSLQALLP